MSVDRCLMCGTIIPEGKAICYSCENPHNYSEDCRKCLHFNYCADKGNHNYLGCYKYFIDKNEYVKVIRCKECKRFNNMWNRCRLSGNKVSQNDFCSKGVNKC